MQGCLTKTGVVTIEHGTIHSQKEGEGVRRGVHASNHGDGKLRRQALLAQRLPGFRILPIQ